MVGALLNGLTPPLANKEEGGAKSVVAERGCETGGKGNEAVVGEECGKERFGKTRAGPG